MSVFLEVRHRIKPLTNTAFDLFVDFYADAVVPRMEHHGIDLIGAWQVHGGEMGWDLSIHRYDSMAHAEECLAGLTTDPELAQSIEQIRGQVEIEEVTKLTRSVPYADDARIDAAIAASAEHADKPRSYMLAVLEANTGGLLPGIKGVGALVDAVEGSGALELVTAYSSMIGRTGELTDLWILPRGVAGMTRYRAGDPLAPILHPLREHLPEESLFYLSPLPYSKLQ